MIRLTLLLLTLAPAASRGEDWPQWLGPRRDGTAKATVAAWKGSPEVVWRQTVGEGHSSPVVAGGKVYLHYKVEGKEVEAVAAFDAATGKPLWKQTYPRKKLVTPFGNGPRGTPAVAGGRVFAFGGTGVLSAYDADSGKPLWSVPTLERFNAKNLFFGVSTSPLLTGGKVLVMVGGPEASIVAFDAATGKVAWKALGDPASYSSPTLHKGDALFLTGKRLAALNPADGKVVWSEPFTDALNESSVTPAVFGDLAVVSSVKSGSLAVKAGGGQPAWRQPSLTGYFTTPVPISGKHYFHVSGEAKLFGATATLHCVEAATGKTVWKKAGVGRYHAALVRLADGNVLMLSDNGTLALLAGDPAGFRALAKAKVCGKTWAHPALAGGRVYVRDRNNLICLKVPGAG